MAAFGYGMVPQQYAAAMQYAAYGAAGYDMATYQAALQQQQQQQLAAAVQQQAAAGNTAAAQQLQQQLQQLQQQQQQQAAATQQQQAAAAQQQVAAAGQAQPNQAQAASSSSAGLSVTGCTNATVSSIVRGSYTQYTENHQRVVYRRTEQVNSLDVLIYFWDDRDGPKFSGWWFGPKVGGDQVWAYNPEQSMTPPASGWRVPYDGPIDNTLAVTAGAVVPAAPAPPAPPPPQQASAQQQDSYDMQAYYQKQEEERIRQQQLEQQRRQVEEQRQMEQQMEQQRKRQEEARLRLEQHAALTARKAISELKAATPESFAELCRRLQAALQQELPRCGSLAQRVQQDAAEQIQQATLRIEAQREQRRRDDERRVEEAKSLQELREESTKRRAELVGLVETSEATCGKLKEVAAPVLDVSSKLATPQAVDIQKAVAAACADTREACQEALSFVLAQRAGLELSPALALQTQLAEAAPLVEAARSELLKLQQRVGECLRLTITSSSAAKAALGRCAKLDVAERTLAKRTACFDKYDVDKDGHLNGAEVLAYAKGELGFVVPAEGLARILARLAGSPQGVAKAGLHALRLAVGVLREEAASGDRLREAAEQRKRLEDKKAGYSVGVSTLDAAISGLGEELAKVEETVAPLQVQELAAKLSSKEAAEVLRGAEEQLKASTEAADGFRHKVKELEAGVVEGELVHFIKLECRRLEIKIEDFIPRLAQVSNTVDGAKLKLRRQELREMEQVKSEAARAVKAYGAEKQLSRDELVKAMDKDGDGSVSCADFVSFLEGCGGMKLESASLDALFKFLDEEGKGVLREDVLASLTRVFYRVVQDSVITTHREVKQSKPVRRLEPDEMIEALEGPFELDDVKIKRVRACALKDSAEGWVTVQGNNDTVFLEEHTPVFRLCTSAPLTTDLEATSEVLRQLSPGDAVEVLEWGKTDEAGEPRLRVRSGAAGERLSGWLPGPACGEASVIRLEPRAS